MKKYFRLSTNEAIRHFLMKDSTLAPETSDEIQSKLMDLSRLKSDICVSITLPTNHIAPDFKQDVIQLKNLITLTEKELYSLYDKRLAGTIVENIKEAQESIDHSHDLNSMVLYANEAFSSVVKLPVDLESEVIIGRNFDTRPLYKAKQQNRRYYILSISRQQIRLIEALNDKLVEEYDNDDFPFINDSFHITLLVERTQDIFTDNQTREFFNVADKRLRKYLLRNPLPLILQGDVKSVAYFRGMMDKDQLVISHSGGNFGSYTAREIVESVRPVIESFRQEKQNEYLSKIDNAAGLLTSDLNELFRLSCEGIIDSLYVGNGCSLSGKISRKGVQIEHPEGIVRTDDLLLKLIKNVHDNGGSVIFMEDRLLEEYKGIVGIKRFLTA